MSDIFTPIGEGAKKKDVIGTHQGKIKDPELRHRRDLKAARRTARRRSPGFTDSKGHRKSCKEYPECKNHLHRK